MSTKAVHLFTDMLLIFSSIGILLSVLFTSTTLLENNYIIGRLNNSWNKSPITMVQATHNNLCIATDTNHFSVSNYLWPGSSKGCDCTNIAENAFKARKYKGNYYKGNCIYNQTLAGCSAAEETPSFPLYKWRGRYFCHRAYSEGYFGLITVRSGDNCPIYYRNCGKIDTLANKLCVREVEDCPINHLGIIESDVLNFNVSNENPDGFILTEFHVTDGENVCINSDENLFSEHDYKLFSGKAKKKRTGCNSFVENTDKKVKVHYDTRFKLVDSINKKLYYQQNGLVFVDLLPQFLDLTKNHSVKLFTAPYIGWDKNCMYIGEKSILEEFNKLSGHLKNIDTNNKSIVYLSSLILLYIGIVIFFLKYKYSDIVEKELTVPEWFINKFFLIYLIFNALNYYIYQLVRENKNSIYLNQNNTSFFDSLFNENCSDYETNISLKHFGKEFFSCIRRYNYMIIFVLLNTISSIFICIFGFYSKKRPENVENSFYEDKKFL